MDNSSYNSLTQKLIQDGILSAPLESSDKNIFEIPEEPPKITQESHEELKKDSDNKIKKRINQYDLDLIKNETSKEAVSNAINFKTVMGLKILKHILNSKSDTDEINKTKLDNFFSKFFPKLYRAKLIKDALVKLDELNIDTKKLLDKTIPYGESQMRYQDLINYLNCANEIQSGLKKKI